jgi:NADH dehydrogenase
VASQQGEYLGDKLGSLAKHVKALRDNEVRNLNDEAYYQPFKYVAGSCSSDGRCLIAA